MGIRDWITSNIFAAVPILGPYLRHDMQTATSEAIKCVVVLVCENIGMYLIGHVHTSKEVALNTAAMVGGVATGTILFNCSKECGKAMVAQFQNLRTQTRAANGAEEQVQLVCTDQINDAARTAPVLNSV